MPDNVASWNVVEAAGDIAAAGTALAGLILVYLGAVAVRYESKDAKSRSDARDDYHGHARRAFRGIVIALGAAAAALIVESIKTGPLATIIATIAGFALLCSFFIAIKAAHWTLTSIDRGDT